MTDAPTDPSTSGATGSEPMSSARLSQFRRDVGGLKVSGGAANPERQGGRWGIALMATGAVGGLICWYAAYNSARFEEIQRMIILGGFFVGVGIVGAVIWVRNSLTRYFRYWLIRLIYEQREQTDQLVAEQRDQIDRLIEAWRADGGAPARARDGGAPGTVP